MNKLKEFEMYAEVDDSLDSDSSSKISSKNKPNVIKSEDHKHFIVTIDNNLVEVVKKSYVEKIERDLAATTKTLKVLQNKLNKSNSMVVSLTREINRIQNVLRNISRFT